MKKIGKKIVIFSLSILTASLLFSGCNSGGTAFEDDIQNTEDNIVKTGVFLDDIVSGLNYTCGTDINGITNSKGEFLFKNNCILEIRVGNILLGSISGKEIKEDLILTPSEILNLPRNDTTSPEVIRSIRFIQSINDKSSETSIVINEETRNLLEKVNLDLTNKYITDSELNTVLVGIGKTMITEYDAVNHYEKSLNNNLNLDLDTQAPSFPIFSGNNLYSTEIAEVSLMDLEIGTKLYIDNKQNEESSQFIKTVEAETELVSFDLSGEDGVKYFDVYLEDEKGNKSNILSIKLIKDTNKPYFTNENLFNVKENQLTAFQVSTEDINPVKYSLTDNSSTDNNLFNINKTTGEVTFIDYPDYETKNTYFVSVTATDGVNEEIQNVTINITDVSEVVPTLDITDLSISETNTILSLGSVKLVEVGDSPIISYNVVENNQDDSSLFSVNSNGEISTSLTELDYETKSNYTFEVNAVNSAGQSENMSVDINLLNVAETVPVLEQILSLEVNETEYDGSNIGTINVLDSGDTDIKSFSLTPSFDSPEYFNISSTGVISVKDNVILDYDTMLSHDLYYTINATNDFGTSEDINIKITITNSLDKVPTVTSKTITFSSGTNIVTQDGRRIFTNSKDNMVFEEGEAAIESVVTSFVSGPIDLDLQISNHIIDETTRENLISIDSSLSLSSGTYIYEVKAISKLGESLPSNLTIIIN